jgi:membrane-associated phospholipid phosphatase
MAMTPRLTWRVLGWLHVTVTVVVVIITGNHYLVDLVAGAATAVVAWVVSQRVPRFPAVSTEPTSTMVGS